MLTVQEIRNYKVFAGLDDSEVSEIAKISNRRKYDFNDIVFDPDTPSEDILISEDENDAIQIEIPLYDHEERIIIHTLSKGETFSWAILGSNQIRTAIARCLKPVNVIAINGRDLIHIMDNDNHIGYKIMRNLGDIIATRLTYTTIAFRHEIRKARKKLNIPVSV